MAGTSISRMTLREQLTASEKCARELVEMLQSSFVNCLADFHDLNRPIRRRTHYPTMLAVQNSLRKLKEIGGQVDNLGETLLAHLKAIQDSARRASVGQM